LRGLVDGAKKAIAAARNIVANRNNDFGLDLDSIQPQMKGVTR
jgi:hypothetical protein